MVPPRPPATQDRRDELVAAVQALSAARDLAAIQEIVRVAARRLAGADGATFVLKDGDDCHYADEDAIAPLWKGKRFPQSTCISGWAMQNRAAAAIADIYADDRVPHEAYRPTFVKSLLMTPIRSSDPIGAIGVYWADTHQPTAEEAASSRRWPTPRPLPWRTPDSGRNSTIDRRNSPNSSSGCHEKWPRRMISSPASDTSYAHL